MIRTFTDHGEALRFGSEFVKSHGCAVIARSVYHHPTADRPNGGSTTVIASPSSFALLPPGSGPDCRPASGWYFGGGVGVMEDSDAGRALLALEEREPMPGRGEYWFGMILAHTCGFTAAEQRLMAERIEANGTCVWHEAAHARGNGDQCQCGKCRPKPKRSDPLPRFHRGPV